MTTIVYANNFLAADGRITCRGTIQSETTVKVFASEEADSGWNIGGEKILAYGYAGGQSTLEWAVNELKTRSDLVATNVKGNFEPPMHTNFQMLLVTAEGVWKWEVENSKEEHYNFLFKACEYDESCVTGSGTPYAEAGLDLGLDAVQSVKAANKRCIYTGDVVFYLDVREAYPEIKRA